MRERDGFPASVYYDNPRLPGPSEEQEWTSLLLTPYEAETALMNAITERRPLSRAEAQALSIIMEGGGEQDFLAVLGETKKREEAELV